jgi:hypothetical protein
MIIVLVWLAITDWLVSAVAVVAWATAIWGIVLLHGASSYKFFCPGCEKRIGHSLSRVRLGPGKHRCPKCSKEYEDYSVEWPDLPARGRFEYLFPPVVLIILGTGVVFTIAGMQITQPGDEGETGMVAFLMFGLPLVPYFLGRWWQVRKSNGRYEQQQRARAGYNPTSLG